MTAYLRLSYQALVTRFGGIALQSCENHEGPHAQLLAPPTDQRSGYRKEIFTDYVVTPVAGDGRCLFRAVAHGLCLRSGKEAPNETAQRELADELRNKVSDELIKPRDSTFQWIIEGDFNEYVERLRQTYTWGGETELLMLPHVLQMPITVYITKGDQTEGETRKPGLIAIAKYGSDPISRPI